MGAYNPRWRRVLDKVAPFLFKTCSGKNRHWAWGKICYCRIGLNGQMGAEII